MITEDLNLLEMLGLIGSGACLGGLVGYAAAWLRRWRGDENVKPLDWGGHGGFLAGIISVLAVGVDQLIG